MIRIDANRNSRKKYSNSMLYGYINDRQREIKEKDDFDWYGRMNELELLRETLDDGKIKSSNRLYVTKEIKDKLDEMVKSFRSIRGCARYLEVSTATLYQLRSGYTIYSNKIMINKIMEYKKIKEM